jgi:hypothetical protein
MTRYIPRWEDAVMDYPPVDREFWLWEARIRRGRVFDLRERPCCEECCGEICEGKGPHRHALLCANCGRHRGWLSGRAADLLLNLYLGGQLTDAPVLRDGSIRP